MYSTVPLASFRVTGFPMPEVEWLKDGMSISSNPDYKADFDEVGARRL